MSMDRVLAGNDPVGRAGAPVIPSARTKFTAGLLIICTAALLLLTSDAGSRWRPQLPLPGPRRAATDQPAGQHGIARMVVWRQLIKTTGANRTTASRLVVYNRVDKCGSTTMNRLLTRLSSWKRRFSKQSSTQYWKRYLSQQGQANFVELLTRMAAEKPLIYDRHVSYIDFTRLHKNLTACVRGNDPECSISSQYRHPGPFGDEFFQPMTSFFCGHEPLCREFNDRKALQKALQNLETNYAVVGILESFSQSLHVFEKYVPYFFQNIVKITRRAVRKQNRNDGRPWTSPAVKAVLAGRLWADVELYSFASQRLYLQYRRIGGSLQAARPEQRWQ
ncbi:heparan sulfate 2-O-sulfotransferase pipe-like isoform X2 [Pollicipes pollicipes]|uniref:heparan sulfate 2-O-sulfotransferase pipe-like isoform X2 n=1 Tax=Pollicipes pollicipes TaxID=41117 RepID=UPI001884AD55|nr:heparan sulfate 2-O-sulfotransferase pipe-like isoform X2 [Pollicipes pollicipes]